MLRFFTPSHTNHSLCGAQDVAHPCDLLLLPAGGVLIDADGIYSNSRQ